MLKVGEKILYGKKEAATKLEVQPSTITALAKKGIIVAYKIERMRSRMYDLTPIITSIVKVKPLPEDEKKAIVERLKEGKAKKSGINKAKKETKAKKG